MRNEDVGVTARASVPTRELAIYRLAHSILSATGVDDLIVVALDAAVGQPGVSHAACSLFDPAEEGKLQTSSRGFGRDPALGLPRDAARRFFELIRTASGPVQLELHDPELFRALGGVDRRLTGATLHPIRSAKPAGWVGIYQIAGAARPAPAGLEVLHWIDSLVALRWDELSGVSRLQRANENLNLTVESQRDELEAAAGRGSDAIRQLEARMKERTTALEDACRKLKSSRAVAVRAARIHGMGQVAAAFAHEVNNPLAGLGANLEYMHERLDELRALVATSGPGSAAGLAGIDEFEEIIAESQESAKRVSGIIATLKRLGGEEEPAQTLSLNSAVADAATLLEERVRDCASIELNLGTLPGMEGDQLEWGHVILGIVTNAVEALERQSREERGRITITTFAVGEEVTLTVEDDGGGISAALLPHVFEPFTTTKDDPAAGLGLHHAYQAAERRRGSVHAHSSPGEGTTITLVLPVGMPAGPAEGKVTP